MSYVDERNETGNVVQVLSWAIDSMLISRRYDFERIGPEDEPWGEWFIRHNTGTGLKITAFNGEMTLCCEISPVITVDGAEIWLTSESIEGDPMDIIYWCEIAISDICERTEQFRQLLSGVPLVIDSVGFQSHSRGRPVTSDTEVGIPFNLIYNHVEKFRIDLVCSVDRESLVVRIKCRDGGGTTRFKRVIRDVTADVCLESLRKAMKDLVSVCEKKKPVASLHDRLLKTPSAFGENVIVVDFKTRRRIS